MAWHNKAWHGMVLHSSFDTINKLKPCRGAITENGVLGANMFGFLLTLRLIVDSGGDRFSVCAKSNQVEIEAVLRTLLTTKIF